MKSRVSLAAGTMTFDDIDAKIAGSSVRGRLAVGDATPRRIDGAIEADVVDLPALVARAIGLQSQAAGRNAVWNWSDEPFGSGLVGAFTGRACTQSCSRGCPAAIAGTSVQRWLRLANNELSLDDVTGDMAGGRLTGRILFRNADDGLTSQLKASLSGANAATLFAWTPRPSVTGSLDLTAALTGTGLSPIALVGSLKGPASSCWLTPSFPASTREFLMLSPVRLIRASSSTMAAFLTSPDFWPMGSFP